MLDEPEATETEAEETTEQPASQTEQTETGAETDWQAEAEKYKALARKNEQRAKGNAGAAKELEKLKASMMSETEKAVAEAEARGRQAAVTDAGQKLAAAEIKAALTGVVPSPAEIVEDLNLARYIAEDGDVDLAAVEALRKKFEALAPKPEGKPPAGQRPKANLRTVPVAGGEDLKTDMSEWMRSRARNT